MSADPDLFESMRLELRRGSLVLAVLVPPMLLVVLVTLVLMVQMMHKYHGVDGKPATLARQQNTCRFAKVRKSGSKSRTSGVEYLQHPKHH